MIKLKFDSLNTWDNIDLKWNENFIKPTKYNNKSWVAKIPLKLINDKK